MKYDGWRALAILENGRCHFFSRKHHKYGGYQNLGMALAREVRADRAVFDGELVVFDAHGRPVFADLMKSRQAVQYVAFDVLSVNGEDLRALPLVARKKRLKRILPSRSSSILYVDHVKGAGRQLFQLACELDLEGIVAKRAMSVYGNDNVTDWIKIKNPRYSQKAGRGDLFKRQVG